MKQGNGLRPPLEIEVHSEGRDDGHYHSLARSLVLWFLLLALLPLTLVSFISYQQAHSSLTSTTIGNLEQVAGKNIGFIKTWFDYRVMDINVQAESQSNIELLKGLSAGWKKSGKDLNVYVKSYDWAKQIDVSQDDLTTLTRQYDYISDIFLIDDQGNILFSTAYASDLGTNLFTGPYSATRFASAVKTSLTSGRTQFSDFERYAPSNNEVAGFITAPLLDEFSVKVGVVAIKLSTTRVYEFLHKDASETLREYLVGEQGFLRTPISDQQEVLSMKIDLSSAHVRGEIGKASEYISSDGEWVIGLHLPVHLLNVNWIMISEVNRDEALQAAVWLGKVTLGLVLATAIVVMMLAFVIARRITRPIVALVAATKAATKADERGIQQVYVDTHNEIGALAEAFNQMVLSRGEYEAALEDKSKQMEVAISDLEEQKYALDQHAIVAITDVRGTITFVNKRFVDVSGYQEGELIGKNHRMLNSGLHDEAFWRNMYLQVSQGNVWHAEVCNRAKKGHLYWVDTTIVPFLDDQGKPQSYIAIRTEITKSKETEQALIHAKEGAESAAQAKSEFLASMSHEIRTPMNGVLGMLGLLQNTELTEDQRRKASVAQSSAKALLTVINDILDFSKVDAGKLELEELDFDMRHLFEEFVESMALRVEEKGTELILDTVNMDSSRVKGDPGRIRQILVNLVGNAIKFTQGGEIVVRARLQQVGPDESVLSCSVRDTGIGIPDNKRQGLFDAFTQVDASTTREYGGTGLGLSIVKQLCELMGGSISVASEMGEGSCFEFIVLVKSSDRELQVHPKINVNKLSLLIVDDNATNRMVMREQLENWGARVEEAESGVSALALLKERTQSFDIVLLDMQMPGMNGAELGRAIKSNKALGDIKLVMMTSMGHRGDAQYFSDLGFSAYFSKPATASDLFSALTVVADGGDALQQANPLVTRHYLKTLIEPETSDVVWPEGLRLLLVEDNVINQEVALGVLDGMGLQADIANDGIEAIQTLSGAPELNAFDLILMDCQMPEMDGYEAAQNIRLGKAGERNKTIPIIAMTANAMMGDKEKCLAAGMSDYLTKPLEQDDLKKMLCQWLDVVLTSNSSANSGVNAGLNKRSPVAAQTLKGDSFAWDDSIWDKTAALKRLGGKDKNLKKLIKLFYRDMPSQIEALERACLSDGLDDVLHTAHTIKGVAANLSGLYLQQMAGELEKSARSSDRMYVEVLIPKVKVAYKSLIHEFSHYVEPDKEKERSTLALLDSDKLRVLLGDLSVNLRAGNFIDVETLASLKKGHDDEVVQIQLDRLLEQVERFDTVAASRTLDGLVVAAGLTLD